MLIQNTNPMNVAPDQRRVRQGFLRDVAGALNLEAQDRLPDVLSDVDDCLFDVVHAASPTRARSL